MMAFRFASTVVLSAALVGGLAFGVQAQTIKDFEGRYVGTGVMQLDRHGSFGPIRHRDINITINRTEGGGFTLTWSTVFRGRWAKEGTKWKKRTTSVKFKPTSKAGMWRGEGSGDLLAGKQVIWALLVDKSLYVHMVAITDKGGVVTASYRRTLTKAGMRLAFRSSHNGNRVRVVVASLRRVK